VLRVGGIAQFFAQQLLLAVRNRDDSMNVPPRNFGFPAGPPTLKDYPQFDWGYASTHRVETLPEGAMVIHLNDNCIIVLTPFPFPLCSPFKRKANGELFKHMQDPDKRGDAGHP